MVSAGARNGSDAVVCQFALPYGPAVRAAARSLDIPYAVYLRGDDVWLWSRRSPEATGAFVATVRDATLVMAVSQALVREAESLIGSPITRAAVLPNGIDLELLRPPVSDHERRELRAAHRFPVGSFVVLCVADALVRKGWTDLLIPLERISGEARVTLLAAVGRAQAEVDIRAEAARRAPKLEVRLIRAAEPRVLSELYRLADVFCLPTHSEGMSNAVLEAMASGLPVVTTCVGGHGEVITHGRDGMLVDVHAPAQLESSLRSLMADAGLRRSLGRAARRRAERVGTPASAGRRLSALLGGLASGSFDEALFKVDPYAALTGATQTQYGVR